MVLLHKEQTRLESKIEALQLENLRLTSQYEALRTSPEAIRLEARKLGYFRPGDIPVRTLGPMGFQLPPPRLDAISIPAKIVTDTNTALFFRLVWPMLFMIVWVMLWGVERLRGATKTKSFVLHETPPALPVPVHTALDIFHK